MKLKKRWTVMFKLSFIPYIIGILWAIWNAIKGLQMDGYIMFGTTAFWTTIKLIFVAFCIKIPIIPIILIYEILYIVLTKKIKNQSGKKKRKKKVVKEKQAQEIKYNL